jgi:hypothetical protein
VTDQTLVEAAAPGTVVGWIKSIYQDTKTLTPTMLNNDELIQLHYLQNKYNS